MAKPTPPSEIIKGLWIGDMHTALDSAFFKNNNIKAVLNCTPDVPNYFASPAFNIEYMRISVNDSLGPNDQTIMRTYLPSAVCFLYKTHDLDNRNVLVHCHAGIQRSVTATIAYLFKTRDKNLNSVVGYVLSKRPIAYFNGTQNNFKEALGSYCNSVK